MRTRSCRSTTDEIPSWVDGSRCRPTTRPAARSLSDTVSPLHALADVFEQSFDVDHRTARIRAAQVTAISFGWRLFEDFIIAVAELDATGRDALRLRPQRHATPHRVDALANPTRRTRGLKGDDDGPRTTTSATPHHQHAGRALAHAWATPPAASSRRAPEPKIETIFRGAGNAPVGGLDADDDGVPQTVGGPVMAKSVQKSSTGLVPGRPAAAQPEASTFRPQVAFPQVSYSIRRPLIALEMTSCWICSVPSKMSMVSRTRPAVSPESMTCGFVHRSPAVLRDSAEF